MCNSLDSEILIFDKPLPKRNARERKWATLKSTFIIYKVVKYRKILLIYNVYFIFSLVKI